MLIEIVLIIKINTERERVNNSETYNKSVWVLFKT